MFPLGACTHRPFSYGCIGTHGTREVGAYAEDVTKITHRKPSLRSESILML